ncbi:MAG TPA: CBO0543 family protein [Desulfosporosinus sp.]|nr:CBO0543 family protein [Desulfosporosinus sp.]
MSEIELENQMIKIKLIHKHLSIEHWVNYEVFTWQWWVGVACVVIPLVLMWILIDKRRLLEIIAFGFMINILATFLDVVGSELLLWNYTLRILPQIPLLFPVDFVLVPIFYMLVYQRYKAWKQFLLASTILALALAFVAEPLAVYIGQYELIYWKFIYSFPIYIVLAILGKIFANKMFSVQERSKEI